MSSTSPSTRRRSRLRGGIGVAALPVVAVGALAIAPQSGDGSALDYDTNLAMIQASSVRNSNHDDSQARLTPQADLVIDDHLGPRSDYLGLPGGHGEQSFPVDEGGQFRVSCEFSHFAYDDPIVHPGQPGAAHLHMFWGNTDVNAHSTADTLINQGSSTCNGQELNRTGYWAPAMFDASGRVRVPERINVYYKGYGQARDEAQVYPPGAAMVQNEDLHQVSWNEGGLADPASGPTGDVGFLCSDQWRGARSPAGVTIPVCDGSRFFNEYGVTDNPHVTLEMHVKFANCWNGQDPSDPANFERARVGGWFYSECEERVTLPNIEYIIQYRVDVGETTEGWYLASDVDPMTGQVAQPGGSSIHADWWGGWHPEVNRMWIENCTTYVTDQPSGCGHGYLTDGGPNPDDPLPGPALKFRPQYEGPLVVDASVLHAELCPGMAEAATGSAAAYCRPAGHDHGDHGDHGGTMPPMTTAPATTSAPTTSPTTTPPTIAPTTVATTTTLAPTTTTAAAPTTTVAPTTTTLAPTTTTLAPTTTTVPTRRWRCGGREATIVGTPGDDILIGTSGDDVIHGRGGDDLIIGRRGDDRLCGAGGDDIVLGGRGDDRLRGGAGDDRLYGGSGADRVDGGSGTDACFERRSGADRLRNCERR